MKIDEFITALTEAKNNGATGVDYCVYDVAYGRNEIFTLEADQLHVHGDTLVISCS